MHRAGGAAALIAATLFWAGNYVLGHVAVATMTPFSLTWLRWLLAVGPLLLVAHLVERPDWRAVMRHWPFLVMQACFGLAGYNLLLYAALTSTTPFAASLINAANPALIALAAAVVLRQRLSLRGTLGIVIAFIGVLVILTKGDLTALAATRLGTGEWLMLAAIAAWTAYTMAGRLGPQLPPITSTALQALVVSIGLGALAPVFGVGWPAPGPALWSLLFIAVFPSFAAYVLWNLALQWIPPATAGVFLNLITVFTAIAALVSGTPITVDQVVGGVTVLLGVVLTATQSRVRTRESAAP